MDAGIIVAIVVVAVVLLMLARSVRIIPQARSAVIERLGRYTRTATPGLTVLCRSWTGCGRSSTCASRWSAFRRSR